MTGIRDLKEGSVWKASDGRLLRVVSLEPRRIGVRNMATNRLSYMQRRYFEQANAGIGWWLEPHSVPLLDREDVAVPVPARLLISLAVRITPSDPVRHEAEALLREHGCLDSPQVGEEA
jgi:hypothetical protein